MLNLRSIASFVRWRLIPVRYATMVRNLPRATLLKPAPSISAIAATIAETGYAQGPTLPADTLAKIKAIYEPRTLRVVPAQSGHPFVNLMNADDLTDDNPVVQLAFSREILDIATDYFGGNIAMDSIQVLYSWPTEGPLRESQKWHKDYADTKSFHCIIYLNDVLSDDDGPFGFVDRKDTKRIRKLPVIRRIDDDRFRDELGRGTIHRFYARAGNGMFVDPAACYHYGSRCRSPRLAIFITFNTQVSFTPPTQLVSNNAARLFEAGKAIRPDLSEAYLRRLLRMD